MRRRGEPLSVIAFCILGTLFALPAVSAFRATVRGGGDTPTSEYVVTGALWALLAATSFAAAVWYARRRR